MVEKRTYAEIAVTILLLASLGVTVTQEDAADNIYDCAVESVADMYCFKLSKINDAGIQRNCYYNKESPRKYKVCSTGWNKITLEEALTNENIIRSTDASQWLCSTEGCEAIE